MELIEALRTTGAIRAYAEQPVSDEVLWRILDTARFAPNGGNAQSWRVVVVRDQAIRARLQELHQRGWHSYVSMRHAGLRPWSPINDPADERRAVAAAPADLAAPPAPSPGVTEGIDGAPVVLALLADLSGLAAVDRDLDRYTYVGGASVYPFAWSVLLAAHDEGLGGVLTTMSVHEEAAVLDLLGAAPPLTLAAVLTLGYPVHRPRRLTRNAVETFTTLDRLDGTPFTR
ncbi:MAG TPA: nitroreductase family protein [Mycobacterium sp.]|nr:nitroreductase family protein [Mycobacterium sp.]